MKISLCLLTLNELTGCKNDVPRIRKIAKKFEEIYTVDGGSKDGTVEYLKTQNIPVYAQAKPGLNEAYRCAIEHCSTDAIVFFHPKGSIPVKDVLKFRKLFQYGFDVIIGSRIIKGSKNDEDTRFFKPRKWCTVALSIVAALLYKRKGPIIWDVLHGFRGITIKAYTLLDIKDPGSVTIDIEMISRLYKKGLRCIEFPTTESPRLANESHFKTIPTGINIIEYLVRELMRTD
jgi:glycosyltransferase involved in cell wall biosynthesis